LTKGNSSEESHTNNFRPQNMHMCLQGGGGEVHLPPPLGILACDIGIFYAMQKNLAVRILCFTLTLAPRKIPADSHEFINKQKSGMRFTKLGDDTILFYKNFIDW
jgi:hypothetical protein